MCNECCRDNEFRTSSNPFWHCLQISFVKLKHDKKNNNRNSVYFPNCFFFGVRCVKDVISTYKTWNKLTPKKVNVICVRWGKTIYRIVHGMLMIFIHRHMRPPRNTSHTHTENWPFNGVWCQTSLHVLLPPFIFTTLFSSNPCTVASFTYSSSIGETGVTRNSI